MGMVPGVDFLLPLKCRSGASGYRRKDNVISIIAIPIITFFCYKMATSMVFDDSNETKAQFGQMMLGMITAQNFMAAVLIIIDLMMGFPKVLAIVAVLVSFISTTIEVLYVKRFLMGQVSLFESKEDFHRRLREGT